ncbi:MAG: silent information regulator protein Sir2, partial [Verrucomicrobiae bacterium]|nr:silent information regulator protein Sir2 [Verrucomicrobiae bacterium]
MANQLTLIVIVSAICVCAAADTQHPTANPPRTEKPKVQGFARERVNEKMGRGTVAMPTADGKVYVGWRLLADDPKDVAFHVYRSSGGKPVRLNRAPISRTTDFVDEEPAAGESEYFVRIAGESHPPETISAAEDSKGARIVRSTVGFISLKLQGDYTFQKVAIADLDGDGQYDFVIKQPNVNVDPYKNYWKRSPGTYALEAYRHDGKFLWRRDLGWAIEQGVWYSPYVVYDFDGDGRAEVAVKVGEGDPRDSDGRVTSGPEWVAILDGLTGRERARAPWPSRERFPDYNYYCRNQLGVAYLDGKTPCLIVERGTYNVIKLVAYEFRGGKLRELWRWEEQEETGKYRGQGAHCLRAADVDGDGRDEVIIGSAVIDDNGAGLWTTGLGHPDHMTVGDLDPTRPGLEIEYGIEPRQPKNAICMVDAKTGRILWGLDEPTKHIHASGLCADIDPTHPGAECYAGERDFPEKRWLFSAQGKLIAKQDLGGLAPRAAYWDAGLQRALLVKGRLRKFRGA